VTSRRILVDATRWKGGPQPAVDLDVLQDAVFADRRLRLRYRHSGAKEPSTYTVDPYGLVSKAGVWYLVADRRARPRLFRADRVHSATLLADPVKRRPGVELADAWEELRRQVEERPGGLDVTVRVRRSRLDMFLRLNASSLAELPEDEGEKEWVTVRLSYGVVREARQLLQFADALEVVSPPEVRAEVAAAAASVTELYQRVGAGRE
jgi:predicted DNA-binding transcriptional regulator YafY